MSPKLAPLRTAAIFLLLAFLLAMLIFFGGFLLTNGNVLAVAALGTTAVLFLPSGLLLLASLS